MRYALKRSRPSVPIFIFAMGCLPLTTHAVSFGVFDARTLALGGTSVAMSNLTTGHYANPALLALHIGDEDDTEDGQHTLPSLTARYSDAAEIAYQTVEDNLEGQLSSAIDAFNLAPGPETALTGEETAIALKEAMEGVQDQPIFADLFLGYSMTEPGHREGGAFFIGSRVVVNGVADIAPEDLDLIDDYVEALRFIHTGGSEGSPHPELFLADGQLADPNDEILSSARARVGVMTEIGVSAAKLFKFKGQVISLGVSPKAMNLHLFDDEWDVNSGEFISDGNDEDYWVFNFDLGMLWAPKENVRVGLTSKDFLTKEKTSALGYTFKLKARTRLGMVVDYEQVSVGMDLDLTPNRLFANDAKQQELSVGVEYSPWSILQLRAGYSYDLEGTFDGKLTFGAGVNWAGMRVDGAFATSDTDTVFGLQFGWKH